MGTASFPSAIIVSAKFTFSYFPGETLRALSAALRLCTSFLHNFLWTSDRRLWSFAHCHLRATGTKRYLELFDSNAAFHLWTRENGFYAGEVEDSYRENLYNFSARLWSANSLWRCYSRLLLPILRRLRTQWNIIYFNNYWNDLVVISRLVLQDTRKSATSQLILSGDSLHTLLHFFRDKTLFIEHKSPAINNRHCKRPIREAFD